MKPFHSYELPSGAIIEIENVPQRERGAGEVARDQELKPIPFDQVIGPIGEVVQLLFEQVHSAVQEPDHVMLELGVSLKGGTSLVLVSGEGQAMLKVTLSWGLERNGRPG